MSPSCSPGGAARLFGGCGPLRRRLWRAAAGFALFALAECVQHSASANTVLPIPPQGARIWIYRQAIPSEIPWVPYVRINGAIAGAAYQGGAFYRDVVPGHYHISVDSIGTDVDQSSDIDLGPGQEAYIEVMQSDTWFGSVSHWGGSQRPTFYARLMPPAYGSAMVGLSFNYGGS